MYINIRNVMFDIYIGWSMRMWRGVGGGAVDGWSMPNANGGEFWSRDGWVGF